MLECPLWALRKAKIAYSFRNRVKRDTVFLPVKCPVRKMKGLHTCSSTTDLLPSGVGGGGTQLLNNI